MNPKYFMVMRRDPDKKYFLVSLKISNEVGALSQISRVLAVRDMNILEGYTCLTSNKKHAVWSFIAEPLNPRMDRKFLNDLLEAEEYVESIEIAESENGLMIDSLNFPVTWGGGARCIALSADFIRDAFEATDSTFGEEGRKFVYQIGLDYGKERYNTIFASLGLGVEISLAAATKLVGSTGMGRARIIRLDSNRPLAEVEVLDSFECSDRKADHPCSDFIRGTICGAVSAAFSRALSSRETECIAKGDKRCLVEVA